VIRARAGLVRAVPQPVPWSPHPCPVPPALVVPYRLPLESKTRPPAGIPPSAQPEVEQKLYNTVSEVAANKGVVMVREPRITLKDATNTARRLLGMDVSSCS
jgi:hypothetical protein